MAIVEKKSILMEMKNILYILKQIWNGEEKTMNEKSVDHNLKTEQ